MTQLKPTDVSDFIGALDATILEQKLAHILSDMATAVQDYQRKGKVELTLQFVPFNKGPQVQVNATLSYKRPTSRGEATEKQNSVTLFYVNQGGNLTDFPENQTDMFGRNAKAAERKPTEAKEDQP